MFRRERKTSHFVVVGEREEVSENLENVEENKKKK